MYEYKFIKIDSSTKKNIGCYQDVVHEYAKKGWRLHTIFSPIGILGLAFVELVFEKEVNDN
ncbi:TPA: DUF4177 domain-containing protein [Clostridioides difficile]